LKIEGKNKMKMNDEYKGQLFCLISDLEYYAKKNNDTEMKEIAINLMKIFKDRREKQND
jgi:hypothetical protein